MRLSDYTLVQQSNFAEFCRTNILQPIDGLTENRIHHYRRLIYGVIDDSLRSAYPLTENLLDKNEWGFLINKFIENHSCKSPQIWKMPYEFYQFVDQNDFEEKVKYSHLTDLLFFEWKEIEIYMMEDKNDGAIVFSPDFNYRSKIIINKDYDILELNYPVHLKPAKKISKDDWNKYFVLVFRAEDKVQFFDLSPVHVWLVNQIETGNNTIFKLIDETEKIFPAISRNDLEENIFRFINTMYIKNFILGFTNEA